MATTPGIMKKSLDTKIGLSLRSGLKINGSDLFYLCSARDTVGMRIAGRAYG